MDKFSDYKLGMAS